MSVVRRPPVLVMDTWSSAPVVPGGPRAGWVSGNPSNLAGGGNVNCVFDLGPDWDQYVHLNVMFAIDGPSSGATAVTVNSSDTTVTDGRRRLAPGYASGGNGGTFYANFGAGNYNTAWFKPLGRFVIVAIFNADATNPFGSSSRVTVGAYPA